MSGETLAIRTVNQHLLEIMKEENFHANGQAYLKNLLEGQKEFVVSHSVDQKVKNKIPKILQDAFSFYEFYSKNRRLHDIHFDKILYSRTRHLLNLYRSTKGPIFAKELVPILDRIKEEVSSCLFYSEDYIDFFPSSYPEEDFRDSLSYLIHMLMPLCFYKNFLFPISAIQLLDNEYKISQIQGCVFLSPKFFISEEGKERISFDLDLQLVGMGTSDPARYLSEEFHAQTFPKLADPIHTEVGKILLVSRMIDFGCQENRPSMMEALCKRIQEYFEDQEVPFPLAEKLVECTEENKIHILLFREDAFKKHLLEGFIHDLNIFFYHKQFFEENKIFLYYAREIPGKSAAGFFLQKSQ